MALEIVGSTLRSARIFEIGAKPRTRVRTGWMRDARHREERVRA